MDSLKDNIINLYKKGYSINQVSKIVGCSYSKAQRILRKVGISRFNGLGVHLSKSHKEIQTCEELVEIIDGLLLGDASIEPSTFSGRLSISQSGNNQPWIDILSNYFRDHSIIHSLQEYQKEEVIIKDKKCHRKPRKILRTLNYPFFLKQYNRWYKNKIKIIPSDVRLTSRSIALWLCGDGCLCGKGYRIEFCTDGFQNSFVENLAFKLSEKFEWNVSVNSRNRIVVSMQKDREMLVKMVEEFVPECFKYKLDIKLRSKYLKLDDSKILEMEKLRNERWSIDSLAKHFSMSRSGIYGALKRKGLLLNLKKI